MHRDLKPANIKIKPDGTVKVLDFGLAKAMEPSGGDVGERVDVRRRSRTGDDASGNDSGHGRVHVARAGAGRPVDKRGDIWAFGVVLYEMLTRQAPVPGRGSHETLAAVRVSERTARPERSSRAGAAAARAVPRKGPKKRLSADYRRTWRC